MGLSSSTVLSDETEGYNILRVQDGSPAQLAGLEAYFDFILAIGTTRLSQDNESMKTMLKQSLDQPVKLTVFSTRTQLCREVNVTPSNGWGGSGLLGVSIRFCSIRAAREAVWHILDVAPNSPAAQAGLVSQHDFVIGSDAVLLESDDFFSLVETFDERPLKLFVYNTLLNTAREVTLTPRSSWEGPGALGCGIGYGYLHRIPLFRPPGALPLTEHAQPPPYSEKEPLPSDPAKTPTGASHSGEVPAKTEKALNPQSSVLPAMITSVALPGMPPLNVTVPSFSLDEKTGSEATAGDPSQLQTSPASLPTAVQS